MPYLLSLPSCDLCISGIEHEKSLKMSKQDIKDEYKKSEGDPLIKGKIRERQRRMALQRMMQEVPKADVIITNPTHFAIALQYDGSKMEAPTVIAKGNGLMLRFELGKLPRNTALLRWKTSRSPERCTKGRKSEIPFPATCSKLWRKYWHMYISLKGKVK